MEHLYKGPKVVELSFPYLSETNFDYSGDWEKYPTSEGIPLEQIRYHEWRKFPSEKLAQILQNWLFFGLLRSILPKEIIIQNEDFLRVGGDGIRFITTSQLPDYLAKWAAAWGRLSIDEKNEEARKNEDVLKEAKGFTFMLSRLPERKSLARYLSLPLPLEIAFSCALLGEALASTNASLSNRKEISVWSPGIILGEIMESQGWCPFIVSGILKNHKLTSIYYFATLGGPIVKASHRKCTESVCLPAKNIKATHCLPECGCLTLKPDLDKMIHMIRREEIPVLRYRTQDHLETLDIEAASDSLPYVAISHVWSDGLGNPDGNLMNSCQLDRVQKAIDNLSDDVSSNQRTLRWWWLDTLCVPKGDACKEEEQKSISRMKDIYANADKVLIIDSGLGTCNDPTDTLEILARFKLSNWIRRLWTIQEGLFATSHFLLVGSTPVSLYSLMQKVEILPLNGFQQQIGRELISKFSELLGPAILNEMNTTQRDKISASGAQVVTEGRMSGVLSAVSARTSTYQRDEPVCLALLLDINPTPIAEEIKKEHDEATSDDPNGEKAKALALKPSKAGMIKFLKLANKTSETLNPPGCIPPSMIASQGKRLNEPGFRWAPESFLCTDHIWTGAPFVIPNPDSTGEELTRLSGTLCKDGLRVMYPGLVITEIRGDQPLHYNFIIDTLGDENRKPYMPTFWNAVHSNREYEPAWEAKGSIRGIAPREEDSGNIAIIICEYLDLERSGISCVLVKIKRREQNGELIVERLCSFTGGRTPKYDDQEWITEPWKRVRGRWLPITQRWCVD